MRIISGQYRGFQIHAPKQIPARPTTDRSKESLFNILQNKIDLEELQVLDLCAGTGNMSYEFASRGAISVTSVDQNFASFKFIKETYAKLNYSGGQAIKAEALKFVRQCHDQFDLIFADPPYAWAGYHDLLVAILSCEILVPSGLLILEHENRLKLEHESRVDFREYGQSAFSIFQKKA